MGVRVKDKETGEWREVELDKRPSWRSMSMSRATSGTNSDGSPKQGTMYSMAVWVPIDRHGEESGLDLKIHHAMVKAIGEVLADAGKIDRNDIA